MGEARRRRALGDVTVYHHTSTLRTNLIWMAGVIDLEGRSEGVIHPQLGEIGTSALTRRAMNDFPPVAWFTRRREVPQCLLNMTLLFIGKSTGEERASLPVSHAANAIALNRVALGFSSAEIAATPWKEHPGFDTSEGRELNDTAREMGDDPGDWYVSEAPVDVLRAREFWRAKSIANPKMEWFDAYLSDMKKMVTMCAEGRASGRGVFIPPTWLKPEQAERLALHLGLAPTAL